MSQLPPRDPDATTPFALEPVAFEALDGFAQDDALASFECFLRSCRAVVYGEAATRPARSASPALRAVCQEALSTGIVDDAGARAFFTSRFRACRVRPATPEPRGFVTGYYEPRLHGALRQTAEYATPVLARPDDLVTFRDGERPAGFDPALSGARRLPDGTLAPYPDRAAIEAGAILARAAMWLSDPVELFMAQVQGSARVALEDGQEVRLAYDGRNGQPYTSIGQLLIEAGEIAPDEMSLARLKAWLRAHGLQPGEQARELMQRNQSYVFFKAEPASDDGPTGGAGVALTPLRSIAIDRALWAYGLPFFIDASLPWRASERAPFRRLMIAQDTGSAIQGPARADLFFGTGDEAGARAGDIRDAAEFTVFLPLGDAP
jgi:membrane-bound lytic murein transglycosylase A